MSMYEIEDLMEKTVRLIDKSDFKPNEKRNFIWNTYDLQNQFDCSFTHFRLMDILIKNEYVQLYDVEDFPLAKAYPDYFAELPNKEFDYINKNPLEEWSETNQEIAYWDREYNKIFADFGSEFYTINENDICQKYEPFDFGLFVIKEGRKQNTKSIVYHWTSFMVIYLLSWFRPKNSTNELKARYFSEIKKIFHQFDYIDHKALHQGLDINYIPETWLEDMSETQKELIRYITQE